MKIVYACTKSWYQYLLVTLYSLLKYNEVEKLYIFLEDDTLNLDVLKKMYKNTEFIVINYENILENYIPKNHINVTNKFTSAALVRLFLPDLLPEEDKVIYIDVDTIVVDDFSELWNIDITNYLIAGVKDLGLLNQLDYLDLMNLPDDTYINSGVLIMNLGRMRKEKITSKFTTFVNRKKYRFPDQDALNKICYKKILMIDSKYNSSRFTGFPDDMKIVHYIDDKPLWVKNHPHANLWYESEEEYLNIIKEQGGIS